MAIIKSFSPFQNLSNFQTFLVDENPLSDYFRITEFKETFTGGKNGFLIEGSEFLKETTEVKIELLDVEGNPIYFEPGDGIPEYYEGTSKLVSTHVYDDTPIGLGKITILGELKNYVNENGSVVPVPQEWKGVYNVKWERTFKVNKNLSNEDIVRFYKRPLVNIDELVKPIFTKSVNQVTDDSSTVTGIPQLPNAGTDLTNYRAGTFYKLVRNSGVWDIDVDENTIDVTVNGKLYSPTIVEVLNDTEVLVDIPYTTDNNIVDSFVSQPYSITYTDFQNETIGESALTGSFAKIDITQLKTFVGDVARVKVFRKSRSSANDFQFVQESRLESTELLRDITTTENTELSYGRFDESNLSTYWITSSDSHPTEVDSSILSQAVKVDYNGSGVQQLITSQSFSISKDVEYTLNFRTLLSGSVSDDKYLKAYFSGSYENGSPFTQSFVDVTPDGSYVVRKNITENVISQENVDAKLVFEFKGDDWYISNVSLRNAQDTSFSPDEFTLIQDIPRKLPSETFDFRFEFYDINNNYIPVNVVANKTFNGGNDFNTTTKLLTFESDRNAFRYISGSGNPESQQIQFKTTIQNLTGSIAYFSSAFDEDGVYIEPTDWVSYPGGLTNPSNNGGLVTISSFEGTWGGVDPKPEVYSIIYTASIENLEEFETIYRLEDGENAPTLLVTSNANQFVYEPTTLSPKPSGQSITIRAQRKNLASIDTPITINSSSNAPLTYVDTTSGIDTYTISAVDFSASFAQNNFEEVKYEFTGSDVFGVEQSDEITLSKVVNFDGVSIVLSNESVSFPAYSTGLVTASLAPSSGSVQMFIGGTQITHDDVGDGRSKNTFDITTVVGNGVDPTDTSPIDEFYSIQDFPSASDEGSLTLTIEYLAGDSTTTQTFQKIVSYTKSKAAAPSVTLKATPGTQTITSSSIGYEIPQEVEIEVTEGGTDYTFSETLSSIRSYRIQSVNASAGSVEHANGIITLNTGSGEFNGAQYTALIDYKDSETTVIENKVVKFDLNVNKLASSGSDAKTVKLTASHYRVEYDGDENKVPVEIVLTATSQNFKIPEYKFLRDGIPVIPNPSAPEWSTTPTYTIPDGEEPDVEEVNSWAVQVRESGVSYNEVFDNIDIFAVKDGSNAYTSFLTNEVHTFAADSTGKITSTLEDGAFEIRFLRGIVEYFFDESASPADNTYSVSVTSNNIVFSGSTTAEGRRKFTPTTGSWDTSNGVESGTEVVTITDNENSKVFEKVYTFNKSKSASPSFRLEVTNNKQAVEALSTGVQTGSFQDSVATVYEYYNGEETLLSLNDLGVGSNAFPSPVRVDTNTGEIFFSDTTNWLYDSANVVVNAFITDSEGTNHEIREHVSLNKARRPSPTTLVVADNQFQSVTSSSLAIGTADDITFSITEGTIEYEYFDVTLYRGDPIPYKWWISNSTNGDDNLDGTFTPTGYGEYGIKGQVTISYSNSEAVGGSKEIPWSVNVIPPGESGESGSTGPGIVFRGPYDNATSYQFDVSGSRRDAVLYPDETGGYYYATLQPTQGNAPSGDETDNLYWQFLGEQDFFVAAKIAIFEDSYIQNTLNVGTNAGGTGDSANITINGGSTNPYISINQSGTYGSQGYDVDGIFMGMDGGTEKLSLKNGAGNYLRWTGTALEISGDLNFSNGDSISQNGDFTLADGDLTYDGNTFNFSADLDLNASGESDGDFSTTGIYLSTAGWMSSPNFYIGSNGAVGISATLTAGTVKIGSDVSGTLDGLYIDANNYWLNGGTVPFQVGNGTNSFKIGSSGAIGVNVDTGGMQFYNTTGLTQGMSFSHNVINILPLNAGQGAPGYITFGAGTIQGDVIGGKLVITPTTVVDLQGDLDVSGAITADGNITAYASSDRRLKDNITPLTSPLIKISKIGGYEFDWNENQSDFEGHDVGVIAQEIQEVVPEVVTERKDGYLAVRYEKLVPLLIEGIKELTDRVEKLEEENKKLKEK